MLHIGEWTRENKDQVCDGGGSQVDVTKIVTLMKRGGFECKTQLRSGTCRVELVKNGVCWWAIARQ